MTTPAEDVERLERVIEDLQDRLATTQHDVEQVRSAQATGTAGQGRPRYRYDRGDTPGVRAARGWLRGGGARGAREAVGWGDQPSPVAGLQWMAHPFRLRFQAGWYGVRNRARRHLVRWTVFILIAGIAMLMWSPQAPWAKDLPPVCDTPETRTVAAKVATAEPAAVKFPKAIGRTVRRLAGPPPDVRASQERAAKAGRAAVVSILALKAAMRGERDPAQVSAYTASYREERAALVEQAAASCVPTCPTVTGPGGGTMTVGSRTPGLTGESLARDAAQAAGFRGSSLDMAVEVARLESSIPFPFNPAAANPTSTARGMWQIMLSAHQDDPEIKKWADPYASARMAYRISKGGRNWSPWATAGQARANLAKRGGGEETTTVASAVPCVRADATTYRTGAGTAWGGYANGRIPASALATPGFAPRHRFRPDAAAALQSLAVAYRARFGSTLGVTDSYRDYAGQVSCTARKGSMCARPGTSNHGLGLAADLIVGGYGDARYQWLRANAPAFGWDNPSWARTGGSKPEPWHWEFNPSGATA